MRPVLDKLHKFLIACFSGMVLICCLNYISTDNIVFAQSVLEAQKVRIQKLQIEAQRAYDLRRTMAQRFLWDWGGSETFTFNTYDDPVLISDDNVRTKRRTLKSIDLIYGEI